MSELLNEKKYTVEMGDQQYELSEMNLNTLAAIEDEFGCGIDQLQDKFNQKQASSLLSLAWILLKEKHPELTKDEVGKQINLKNIKPISEQLFNIISESIGE